MTSQVDVTVLPMLDVKLLAFEVGETESAPNGGGFDFIILDRLDRHFAEIPGLSLDRLRLGGALNANFRVQHFGSNPVSYSADFAAPLTSCYHCDLPSC
jgi:hypothetical protein